MGASITLTLVPSAVTAGAAGSYTRGEELVIDWTVKNTSGVVTAPSDITFTVRTPGGVDTDYTTADPELVDNADGTGTFTIVLDESARWLFRCVTDTPTTAAETDVMVERSPFESPVIPVPGAPGIANEGAIARASSGVYQPYLAEEEGETLTAREVGAAWVWQKRRGWIVPDVDLTGVDDATATINAALATRVGACVFLPDGIIRVNGGLVMGTGTTLTSNERGMRRGGFVDTPFVSNAGCLIKAYSTSVSLFTSADEATICNLEAYYPNQATGATAPTAYPYTFDITHFGCTVENMTVVNPYNLMEVDVAGVKVDTIYSFPFNRGIVLRRMPDVARIANVHFNPNLGLGTSGGGTAAIGSGALAHALASGIAFIVDGAEGYSFTDCFCGGYVRGLHLGDEDADGFKGGSGIWYGGGWDQCVTCIYVDAATAIGLTGLVITGAGIIPYASGNGVHFGDTAVPASDALRPRIEMNGCLFDSPGGNIGVLLPAASYGVAQINGGVAQNIAILGFNDSTNAYLRINGLTTVSATVPTRTAGAGSANTADTNGLTL